MKVHAMLTGARLKATCSHSLTLLRHMTAPKCGCATGRGHEERAQSQIKEMPSVTVYANV